MRSIIISFYLIFLLNMSYSQSVFYGLTTKGGKYGAGTIFSMDSSGTNHQVVYDFYMIDGNVPYTCQLIEASNGMFYGMTRLGGVYNKGVLFGFDNNSKSYYKLIDFNNSNGQLPAGGLIETSNDMLFGITEGGGSNGMGIIFAYDIALDTLIKKYDFDGSTGEGPRQGMIQASNGKLYGVTMFGGTNNYGVLFEFDVNNDTLIVLFEFDGVVYGKYPNAGLIQASNGKLYGCTASGGLYNEGIFYEYDLISDTILNKFDFNFGGNPNGELLYTFSGKIFGCTYTGGLNDCGTIFEYDILADTIIKKIDFEEVNHGSWVNGSLIQASNGKLYGTTNIGGVYSDGVIFEYDPDSNTINKLVDFSYDLKIWTPRTNLMQAANGCLYGMAEGGGGNGVIFGFNNQVDTIFKVLEFGKSENGKYPESVLHYASNGKIYGTTVNGGHDNSGVLFEFNPLTYNYNKLLDFSDTLKGKSPMGCLLEVSNKLYGTTKKGGGYEKGVLFEFDLITHDYNKKYEFSGNDGRYPEGNLVLTQGNIIYGTTKEGGVYNNGILFEYDVVSDGFSKKIDFQESTIGQYPGSLLLSDNGVIYGMTGDGLSFEFGDIYEYDPVSEYFSIKYDFGLYLIPAGNLVQISNDRIIGIATGTTYPYYNDYGELFELNLSSNIYTKLAEFDYNYGTMPYNNLLYASNGNVYGMTFYRGHYDVGTLFEYNPGNGIFSIIEKYNGLNGASPLKCGIVEINQTNILNEVNLDEIRIFPNPSDGIFYIKGVQDVEVYLYSIKGELVKNFGYIKDDLDVSNLCPGMYYLELRSGNEIVRKKIIIE